MYHLILTFFAMAVPFVLSHPKKPAAIKKMLLVIFAGILALYYLLVRPYNFWKDRGVKQGRPWIIFGDSWRMIFRVMDIAAILSYTYELIPNVRYYGIYQFVKPKLVIRDPELIRRVTVKDFDHFVDHVSVTDPKADPLFSKNLISLKGDEWRKMRSTLTGSFTSSKMKVMFNLISEAAENFAKYFENKEGKIHDIEIKDAFTRFTIDVIATTSFGVKVDSLAEPNNDFFKMGKEITELSLLTFLKVLLYQFSSKIYRFLNLGMFRKEVNDFFRNLINSTIRSRETQGIYRPDMIQILMEARKGIDKDEDSNIAEVGFAVTEEAMEKSKIPHEITNEDITAQAVIFFFAGFDSVSSLLTFTSYELAINQDVQDKLREEIWETHKESNGKISYEAIAKMKYMDMVITEALRKWPPFIILGRECTKTYVIEPVSPEEKTLVIPKGMAIQIPSYAIHHDPKYYPNPEKFIPERFSPENRSKLTPYTFLGFGQGPRGCIGSRFALLEIKTIIFYLLFRLKVVTTEKTQIPVKLSKKFSINIRPENGLWLGLQKLK